MLTIVYIIFTILNLFMFKKIYWPILLEHFSGAKYAKKIIGSWWLLFVTFITIQIIYLKQKWFKNVEYMGNDKYKLVVVLNGKIVHLIVEPVKNKPIAVFDQNFDLCLTEDFISFFQYQSINFCPKLYGHDSLNLYFENGTIVEYKG